MLNELKVLCFFDVLGFEKILQKVGLRELTKRYKKLTEYIKEQKGGIDVIHLPDGHVAVGWLEIGNAYFSDTLLFWTNYNKVSLPSFTHLIAETICYSLEHELPFRGAMVVGNAILDSESGTYLGYPIIEAARTEQLQKWIGVSLGESFSKPDFNKGFHLNTVLPYKSHYKKQNCPLATGIVIDWPRRWRETRKTDVRALIKTFDIDSRFSEYYSKTLEFIDFSEQNNDWFKKQGNLDYG